MEYFIDDFEAGNIVADPEVIASANRELALAERLVNETNVNLFLTGKAGTGKTTFLRKLQETSAKRMVVVAPTGVAAINARGVTAHSFFQLSLSVFIPGKGFLEDSSKRFQINKLKRRIISTLDLLIIDEVSMVRPDTLDAIDDVLRRVRGNDAPFGGVQLLLIGDLRQLAPVVRGNEWDLMKPYYASPYFFESQALKKAGFLSIELLTVYRQNDPTFIDILNAVRDGQVTQPIMDALNSRYIANFTPRDSDGFIYLTTHNQSAHNINENKLQGLPAPAHSFKATVTGEFPESSYPADNILTLKVGAQVMFIKNDIGLERRFYNGLIGYVEHIGEETIVVKPANGKASIEVGRAEWENSRYALNNETGELTQEVIGVFQQFPLRLAWAITIHKSQGLTFDHAIIDAGRSFAPGQTYVALSRCRTLEGMVLTAPIPYHSIIVDPVVNGFIEWGKSNKPSENIVNDLCKAYQRSQLVELFDFNGLRKAFGELYKALTDYVIPVNYELSKPLNTHEHNFMNNIWSVSEKFKALCNETGSDALSSPEFIARIQRGCDYFAGELMAIVKFLKSMDYQLENRTYITRVNNAFEEFMYRARIKYDILACMAMKQFSTEMYNRIKTKAILDADNAPTPTPARKVREKRVVREKSLKEASTKEQPVKEKAVKEKAVKEKIVKEKIVKEKAPKQPKGYSPFVTLGLFKEGKSLNEIAAERELALSTVAKHLQQFINQGEITLESVIGTAYNEQLKREFDPNISFTDARAKVDPAIPDHIFSLYFTFNHNRT